MSIDYFNRGDVSTKKDKSDWFASVTCLLGCLNGNVTSGSFGYSLEKHRALASDSESKRDAFGVIIPQAQTAAFGLLNII